MNISNDGVNSSLKSVVPGECLTQYLMSAGGVFIQLPSVCGMCFPLVLTGWALWLICLKIVNSCSRTWWYLRPARGAEEVGTWSFLQLWCGYQCSPNPAADSTPQPFWKLKTLRSVMAPPWGGNLAFGGELLSLGVPQSPQHGVGSNAQRGFACLLLPGRRSIASCSFIHYTGWKQKSDIDTESINHC